MARKIEKVRGGVTDRKSVKPAARAATVGDMHEQRITLAEMQRRLHQIAGELGRCREESRIVELKKERDRLEALFSSRGGLARQAQA